MKLGSIETFMITDRITGCDLTEEESESYFLDTNGYLNKAIFDEDEYCYYFDVASFDCIKRHCTGFRDKKRNLIYEYDVLSNKDTILVVAYSDEHAAFVCWNPKTDVFQTLPIAFDAHRNLRVIGNKFQKEIKKGIK